MFCQGTRWKSRKYPLSDRRLCVSFSTLCLKGKERKSLFVIVNLCVKSVPAGTPPDVLSVWFYLAREVVWSCRSSGNQRSTHLRKKPDVEDDENDRGHWDRVQRNRLFGVAMFHLRETVGQLSISSRQRVAFNIFVGTWHFSSSHSGKEKEKERSRMNKKWWRKKPLSSFSFLSGLENGHSRGQHAR